MQMENKKNKGDSDGDNGIDATAGKNEIPTWLRVLNVTVGAIAIILSAVILIFPGLAIATLVVILSVTLLLIGISSVTFGIACDYLSKGLRVLVIITGILSIALSTLAIVYPGLATVTLIYLLAFAMISHGISRVCIAGMIDILPNALRVLIGINGLLTVVFAAIIFLFPALGAATLVVLLSLAYMINGIENIVLGIILGKMKSSCFFLRWRQWLRLF
jgi:uncharacterized membrane protein HdeD (DUF308 family)